MRKLYILMFIYPLSSAHGQTPLTWAGNGFRDGDCLVMRRVESVSPGLTGRDAIWDFNDADTGRKHISQYIQQIYVPSNISRSM